MKLRHRIIAAAGVLPTASCAPTPVAHRGSTAQAPAVADPQPVTAGDRPDDEGVPTSSLSVPVPTTETVATIATVSGLPPTTDGTTTTTVRPRPLATTTLPEYVDEAMSDVEWAERERILACIRRYEGSYDTETDNGHHGAYQFVQATWDGVVGRAGYPQWVGRPAGNAPPHVQDDAAWLLYLEQHFGPWPPASRYCRGVG